MLTRLPSGIEERYIHADAGDLHRLADDLATGGCYFLNMVQNIFDADNDRRRMRNRIVSALINPPLIAPGCFGRLVFSSVSVVETTT